MKAKIVDVKIILKSEKSGGPPPKGTPKPPKNVEGFDDDDEKEEDGQEGGEDADSGKDKKGKGKGSGGEGDDENGENGDDDEQGGGNGDNGDEDEDGEEKGQKSSGSGGGTSRGFKEIDPMSPAEFAQDDTPWTPPKGQTVVGEVLPAGTLGDGEKGADEEKLKDKWKDSTTAAESQARGNVPGAIKKALERMRASVVDWKKELEKYIDDAVSKTKYVVPARRFQSQKTAQYGYKRYKEDFECVVVAIDTSGSISDNMVSQFLGEVKGIVDAYSPQDLYILFCHSELYRTDHIRQGEPIEVGELESGGTDFHPPFEWVEENLTSQGTVPSCFIYFTDGESTFPQINQFSIAEYADKCIWVFLTFNGTKYPNDQPFGERIDIALANKGIKTI